MIRLKQQKIVYYIEQHSTLNKKKSKNTKKENIRLQIIDSVTKKKIYGENN